MNFHANLPRAERGFLFIPIYENIVELDLNLWMAASRDSYLHNGRVEGGEGGDANFLPVE